MKADPVVGVSELDQVTLTALSAMDRGDLGTLSEILSQHPRLVHERFDCGGGYFQRPYLLWFVAGNPVRLERLPDGAPAVARTIIELARQAGVATLQEQVDYTLCLVCSGRVPRESGVQIGLIDVLVDAGADPSCALEAALAHREESAIRRLLERGAGVTLPVAAALGSADQVRELAGTAAVPERQTALAVAAIWGRADSLRELTRLGVDLDAFNPPGFHAHATALHNAVAARSLSAVRALVEAGASTDIRDEMWAGTPVGWAEHLGEGEIAAYLRSRAGVRG